MSYLVLPDLVAIAWMAVVLYHLRSRHVLDMLHLWITGLALVVAQGVAWVLSTEPLVLSPLIRGSIQTVGLDCYLLAGVAFFQSGIGKLRHLPQGNLYLLSCVAPQVGLVTCFAAGVERQLPFLLIAGAGLLLGVGMALALRRPRVHLLCHAALWLPVLAAVALHDPGQAAFLLLSEVYAATAIAFVFTLPRGRWGRGIVVSGFALWSLSFLIHIPVARHWPGLLPLADRVWDLQKFLVTFGLLIVSMEQDSANKEHLALHDTLTGLPNRRLFHDRLTQALAYSTRRNSRVLLFNIDLDNFKLVNDQWGHQAGDALLQEIGARLSAVTRLSDTLARMGGDEFQLIINDFAPQLPLCDANKALDALCHQVRESFRHEVEKQPFLLYQGGHLLRLQPRLSIGSALYPEEADNPDDLCRLADQQMYRDKRERAAAAVAGSEPAAMHLRSHIAG